MLTACLAAFALMNGFACDDSASTIPVADVVVMARGAGFTEEEIPELLCVIDAESDYRPGVISYNGSSFGLTQVHFGWWEGFGEIDGYTLPIARPEWNPQTMMDAGNALHAAKYIYDRSGWYAWDGYEVDCV